MHDYSDIPLTNNILEYSDLSISSFHALPISKNKLNDKSNISNLYEKLIGAQYLKNEVTYGSDWIDNPTFPVSCLEESQQQTAHVFGCDYTIYLTTGTTCANQISIYSSVKRGDRVLVDRTCHQSIHFSLSLLGAEIVYSKIDSNTGCTDFEDFVKKYQHANDINKPFSLVIFNASSYEGICTDSVKVINACLDINSNVTFLVDEAWIAFAAFHKTTRKLSLLSNLSQLHIERKDLKILVNQSAHKSLRSLRQGSYLHIIGNSTFIDQIKRSKYEFHTTSPSYPILASLELARKDMSTSGEQYIERSLNLAKKLRNYIAKLNKIKTKQPLIDNEYFTIDPLRILIDFSKTQLDIDTIKKVMKNHGIYISRYSETSFLVNLHISIDEADYLRLVSAIQKLENFKTGSFDSTDYKINSISNQYIIPYPPGVPLVVPGEKINTEMLNKLRQCENAHTKIVKIRKV